MKECQFCNEPAVVVYGFYTSRPPMCEKHLDLSLLATHLRARNLPVVAPFIEVLLAMCQARTNGLFTLKVEEVRDLFTEPFRDHYTREEPAPVAA